MWGVNAKVKICTSYFVFFNFITVICNPKTQIGLGHLITALAVHFGIFDPSNTHIIGIQRDPLDITALQKAEVLTARGELLEPTSRKYFNLRGRATTSCQNVRTEEEEQEDECNEQETAGATEL